MASRQDRPSVIMGFPPSSHRYSAASGVAFVVLLIASFVAFGFDFPTYDDSGKVFASYYADNSGPIQLSILLGGFSVAALVWFIGFMRWVYGRAETAARGFVRATDIGFAAGIAGAAISLVMLASQEAAVVAAGTVEPGVIRALDLLGDYALVFSGVLLGIWLLTSVFVIRVTKVFPEWLALLAVGGTVLAVLQSVVLVAPQDDDGVLGLLGIAFVIVLLVWTAGASITLVRRVESIEHGR
ncbi:MAG: hypothetical protein QOD24_3757 [Solirubrobacteraceae bacterium]|nr:hypothetical protein [Solirubrobacteraceae bacterium]